MRVSVCVFVCVGVYFCMCLRVYVCMHVCMSVCIRLWVCIYACERIFYMRLCVYKRIKTESYIHKIPNFPKSSC